MFQMYFFFNVSLIGFAEEGNVMEVLKKRGKEMSNDRKNIEVLYK